MNATRDERLAPLLPGHARIGGRVGQVMDAVTEERYLSRDAEREILREAVDAFRNRVDDRMNPGKGFWQGEFWGKWVLGAVAACRYSGNPRLKTLIEGSVRDLLATQDDNGYIGTYHDSGFGQCEEPIFEWNLWCRKYTLWGLIEAYELLGDKAILTAACRFMDHLAGEVGPGRFDIVQTGCMEGLPSSSLLVPVTRLYRHTRKKRYLDYALYIVAQWAMPEGACPDLVGRGLAGEPVVSWFPRSGQADKWGGKAYELLSCAEGIVELYRETDNADLLTAARHLFASILNTDRHITGGLGNSDRVSNSRFLVQAPAEVCDAVHWGRLAEALLRLSGEAAYAEEIERTLYNTLLAAPGLNPAWGVRRLLLYGAYWIAPEHCQLKTHHCCVANLPRGLYQAAQMAVMQSAQGLVLQLYLPGVYQATPPSGQAVTLTVETDYPANGSVLVRVDAEKPLAFELRLRVPSWDTRPRLQHNDTECSAENTGGYMSLARTWKPGDTLAITFDMTGRLTRLPSPAGIPPQPFTAVERGPLVLARDRRLGDAGSIHDPVLIAADAAGRVELQPRPAPDNLWLAFEAPVKPGPRGSSPISLCDYSSAGNTWEVKTSDFRVWLPEDTRDSMSGI